MPRNHRDRPPTYPIGVLPVSPAPEPDEQPVAVPIPPPAASATRAKWATYAEALGVPTLGLTKTQIRKKVT